MQTLKDLFALPRSIWILCFSMLINRMGTMAMVFLSLHLTKNLGFSLTTAGLVLGVYGLAAFLTGPFAGIWSDKLGSALVAELSLGLSGIMLLLYPFVTSLPWILVMTVILAVVSESFRPACLSLLSDLTPSGQRALSQALYRLAINLGMSVGPALGGFLALVSYKWIFWIDGSTCLVALLFLLFTSFRRETRQMHQNKKQVITSFQGAALKNRKFVLYLLAILPALMVMFQFGATFPLYVVQELHFPESSYGLLCVVNTILVVLIEIPFVVRFKNVSIKTLISFGSLMYGIGFGALILAHSFWSLSLAVAVWTVGEVLFCCSSMAYVTLLAPENQRGEYMGYYTMSFAFMLALAPFVGTYIMQEWSSQHLWGFCFAAGVLSMLLLQRVISPRLLLKEA